MVFKVIQIDVFNLVLYMQIIISQQIKHAVYVMVEITFIQMLLIQIQITNLR